MQRVNLVLDEPLIERLRQEARRQRSSMSEVARRLLDRGLETQESGDPVERIRRLRESLGPMSDSAAIIRQARDRR